MAKKAPAHLVLQYGVTTGVTYLDLARDLSAINRRLYKQGMQYAVSHIDFEFNENADAVPFTVMTAAVAGDTWVVHNAWKKGKAHWDAQQRRTRRLIGASAKPTWEDFKVYLDDAHQTTGNLPVVAGDGNVVGQGEWEYSRLLYEIDNNTVYEPLLHLIGGDVSTSHAGLILAYQQSRATVQAQDPDLPGEYSTNLYALMAADQDAVADEVADNMEFSNDEPPYDQNDYPGNDTNCDAPWVVSSVRCNSIASGRIGSFVAQNGLVKLFFGGVAPDGSATPANTTYAYVHLAPGGYQGVAAIPMGQ